jgi:hypothetical protein
VGGFRGKIKEFGGIQLLGLYLLKFLNIVQSFI